MWTWMSMLIRCICTGLLKGQEMTRLYLFPSCRAFVLQEVASAVLMVVMGIFCWKLNLAGTFYIARKKVMVILARESLSKTSGLVLCCCKWHSIQKPYNLRGQTSRGLMWRWISLQGIGPPIGSCCIDMLQNFMFLFFFSNSFDHK